MLTRQRFRVTKNGNGVYRVERFERVPGDLDGGSEWVPINHQTFSSEAVAKARMDELIAQAEAFERETTWTPV